MRVGRKNLGTVSEEPIDENILNAYIETFERDWSDSEVKFGYAKQKQALIKTDTASNELETEQEWLDNFFELLQTATVELHESDFPRLKLADRKA